MSATDEVLNLYALAKDIKQPAVLLVLLYSVDIIVKSCFGRHDCRRTHLERDDSDVVNVLDYLNS